MAYKKPENKWNDLVKVRIVDRNENSQMRIAVVQKDGDDAIMLSLREFAKYVTKAERAEGLTKEDAVFRPTTCGCTIPIESLDDFMKELQQVNKELKKVKEGL